MQTRAADVAISAEVSQTRKPAEPSSTMEKLITDQSVSSCGEKLSSMNFPCLNSSFRFI